MEKSSREEKEGSGEYELKDEKVQRKSQTGRQCYARNQGDTRVFIIVKLAMNHTIYTYA